VADTSTARPEVRKKRATKWTVMVFMGADNPPGEEDLTQAAHEDIAEMEKAVAEQKERTLEVVYQLHTKEGAVRRRIGQPERLVPLEEQDPTAGFALMTFVKQALEDADHDDEQGDLSMLVLWGHAHRFAIGAHEVRGGVDALDFGELADTLQSIQDAIARFLARLSREGKYGSKPSLDILAFDSCDAATVEMGYQFHQYARYLLASQIRMPIPGFPYQRILDRLAHPQGRLMGPAEFGSYAVRRFCEWYSAGTEGREAVTLSLLDLQQAPAVFDLTERLARKLAQALYDDAAELELVQNLFRASKVIDTSVKPFVDVVELCLNLSLHCNNPDVRDAALALGDFLVSAKPFQPGQSGSGTGRPFVVERGGNACTTARYHGVNLYAPVVADAFDWTNASNRYSKFVFAQKTLWGDLMRAFAQPV
jgi:hypothetical protein